MYRRGRGVGGVAKSAPGKGWQFWDSGAWPPFERTRTVPTLKFHPAQLREALDPIPFPRSSWGAEGGLARWREGAPVYRFAGRVQSASAMAESAVERAQRQMDRLKELLGSADDDRPSAA